MNRKETTNVAQEVTDSADKVATDKAAADKAIVENA